MRFLALAAIMPLASLPLSLAEAPRRTHAGLSANPEDSDSESWWIAPHRAQVGLSANPTDSDSESLLLIRREGTDMEAEALANPQTTKKPKATTTKPKKGATTKKPKTGATTTKAKKGATTTKAKQGAATTKAKQGATTTKKGAATTKAKTGATTTKKGAATAKPTQAASASGTVSLKATQLFQAILDQRKAGATCTLAGGGTKWFQVTNEQQLDCKLWKAAKAHSEDMAAKYYFDHVSPTGTTPDTRAAAVGAKSSGREVIAATTDNDFKAPLKLWLNSQTGHCAAIMDPNNKRFAVEFAKNSGNKKYWTGMPETDTDDPLLQDCKRV